MEPLIVQAIKHLPLTRPPVWLMRQAGRYLSEYRELKEQHGFLTMCRTPELAARVTLQPVEAFDVDGAVIFSDILVIAAALGLEVDFNPGPKVRTPIRSRSDIESLRAVEVQRCVPFVFDLIAQVKSTLQDLAGSAQRKAVIGFAGAPWTVACYLIDQGPFKMFEGTQVLAQRDPAAMHSLLRKITDATCDYILGQVESGADLVQLFDTWAGTLDIDQYRTFALPCIQELVQALHQKNCPSVLYINGSAHLLPALPETGADCISVDWRTSLGSAQALLGEKIAVQGNLNPVKLFSAADAVRSETQTMLRSTQRKTGYIANLGHGVLPTTPRENVAAFVNSIKEGWPI